MRKNNTPFIVGLAGLVLLLVVGGMTLALKGNRKTILKPTPTLKVNLIETTLEDRPYVTLTPDADAHQFTMRISRLKFGKTLEYEFSYQTKAGLSQGAIGTIELKGESELTEKFLLGACSRNVCRYDEGVEKGTLVLRFRDQDGLRKFTTDFHLQKGVDELTSLDGNFQLTGKLPSKVYYITMGTIGLPASLNDQVIAGPYGIFSPGTSGIKEGKVSLVTEWDNSALRLLAWDGSSWETLKGEVDGGISSSVSSLGTFILSKD